MNDTVKKTEHREAYHYALLGGILFIAAFAVQVIKLFSKGSAMSSILMIVNNCLLILLEKKT